MNATLHSLPAPGGVQDALARLNLRLAGLAGVGVGVDAGELGDPPDWALDALATRLALSPFERDVILFAAAAELVGSTRALVERLGGGAPSLGLALRVCDGASWAALRPDGALRRARLIGLGEPAARLTERPLHVEEPVLHFLHGVRQLDPRLVDIAAPPRAAGDALAHSGALAQLAALLAGFAGTPGIPPLIEIVGGDVAAAVGVATAALDAASYRAVVLPVARLPREADALAVLRGAWLRDALLHDLGLVLVADGRDDAALPSLACGWMAPALLVTPRGLDGALGPSVAVALDADGPGAQRLLWRDALGAVGEPYAAIKERLAESFRLPPNRVRALAAVHRDSPPAALWSAARVAARPAGDPFLERIEARSDLTDVIVPPPTRTLLEAIVAAVRARPRVLADWGFADTGARGLGIAALFVGESGTGKTMAAEGIARALDVDLYRVEVSAVVSKYIGETEKHLRHVFDAAERAGCVLLFDEADTLFGKRGEVRDAHDRYANLEVGYLLQLMEAYRGLAILTTNLGQALDAAFMRRLRFVVRFPLPGVAERRAIWERVFPAATPVCRLDHGRLAKLAITGGMIRNIALGAAFRAAGEGGPVSMPLLLESARAEFAKLDRPMSEIDVRDWA